MGEHLVDIFEDIFGENRKHTEHKGQIAFDCPACAHDKGAPDGKGNLEINYKMGVFKCWACSGKNHMKGRLGYLIKRFGTKHHLSQFNLVKPESFDYDDDEGPSKVVVAETLPEGYYPLAGDNHWRKDYDSAIGYLKKRGIGFDIIKKFNIGYCADGKFHHRIIIPSYDENNVLNYFIGRSILSYAKPKYLNSQTPKEEIIFNRSLINPDSTIYLVEGPFDSLVVPNCIPLLGLVLSDLLLDFLQTHAKADIVVVMDGEAREDTVAIYRKLDALSLKGRVRAIFLNEEYDMSLINERFGKRGIGTVLNNESIIPEFDF